MKSLNLLSICIVSLLFCTLLLSCNKKSEEPRLEPLTAAEISGARLWERISEESSYQDYSQWPGHEGIRPGQSPHGTWHKVYSNRSLTEALPLSERIAPYGSIIIKENFTASKELDKLTVMAKVEGYSPENNDWFWAVISPKGEILTEGTPGGCLSCHSGRLDNDYVIIKNLDETLK